jgi:hypothetical protein
MAGQATAAQSEQQQDLQRQENRMAQQREPAQ